MYYLHNYVNFCNPNCMVDDIVLKFVSLSNLHRADQKNVEFVHRYM